MPRILIAEDKPSMRKMLAEVFAEKGYEVSEVTNGEEALLRIEKEEYDCVITDLKMPKMDGLELLSRMKTTHPHIPVIMITAFGTIETAVEAMRRGACDYILKPFSISEIEVKVEKAIEQRRLVTENLYLKETLRAGFGQIIGQGVRMQEIYRVIQKVCATLSPILILGESGTGKELVAREIHRLSPRADRPFVAVNCAALSEGLLESELFGHEKGSFTGATAQKKGRVEIADGGTLFLDEIAELPPSLQVKLLRFLQEKEFERVGGIQTLRVDVRIIAATNRDLQKELEEKRFRDDLYFRINVVTLTLPPLRERREDIGDLVEYFLARFNKELHRSVRVPPEIMDLFMTYHWPGNVRELANVVERAIVLSDDDVIHEEDLPPEVRGQVDRVQPVGGEGVGFVQRIEQFEREIIKEALEKANGNQSVAAQALSLKRSTLQYKIKKYGIM